MCLRTTSLVPSRSPAEALEQGYKISQLRHQHAKKQRLSPPPKLSACHQLFCDIQNGKPGGRRQPVSHSDPHVSPHAPVYSYPRLLAPAIASLHPGVDPPPEEEPGTLAESGLLKRLHQEQGFVMYCVAEWEGEGEFCTLVR